jgi:hypothetical protein
MWLLPRRLGLAGVLAFSPALFFATGFALSARFAPDAAFASEPIRTRLPSVVLYTLGIVSEK